MPLHQHIEGSHGEGKPGMEIRPDTVHDLLEMADERQHREDRLYEYPVLPLTALTQFKVGRIALRGMEGGITEDNHLFFKLSHEPLKGVIRHIGGRTRPRYHQPRVIAS